MRTHSAGKVLTRRIRPDPILGAVDPDLKKNLNGIHNLVVNYLSQGRVAWTVTMAGLEAIQPSQAFTNEEGRLCFYCMGLFKKQAFQVDHINPSHGRNETTTSYNNPGNLIPVCRTCNTSKAERGLSTNWLEERIRLRIEEGLPGLELIDGDHGQNIDEEVIDFARRVRVQLIGL